jgi:hypothetical protein
LAHLRSDTVASEIAPRQLVREVSYAGILCHIEPNGSEKRLVVSLTHLRLRRSLLFAAAALDYQKHRVKKLKKQQQQS